MTSASFVGSATARASWLGAPTDPQPVDGGSTYGALAAGATGTVHNRATSVWTAG
jgi:hypothetical protein